MHMRVETLVGDTHLIKLLQELLLQSGRTRACELPRLLASSTALA